MPATVSKALSWTLDPILLFLFLLILTTIFASEKKLTLYLLVLIISMLVVTTSPLPEFLMEKLETHSGASSVIEFKEYAVVLGGDNIHTIKKDQKFNYGESFDRVGEALRFYRQKKIGKIIVVGGDFEYAGQLINEAESMAAWLESMGVPSTDILLEKKSRSTLENAEFVREIIDARKISEFYLITSASHMRRALGVFRKLGMNAVPLPVDYRVRNQNRPAWKYFGLTKLNILKSAVHEYVGIAYYSLLGYL